MSIPASRAMFVMVNGREVGSRRSEIGSRRSEAGPSESATAIATRDARNPDTEAMVSSRIRCLAAAIIVAAAHLGSAAQSPSTRAKDLYERALELERRGN